jgi:periplasmic protein TonB
MAAYATQQDSTFLSRRAIVLVAIILLHVLLAYGLATGLARRAMEIIAPPIQTTIVEEVQQHDLPPPPPPPEFERPPVDVPPPDINIDIPAEPPPTAITQVENTPVNKAPPPAHASNKTNPSPGKNFPNSADYYPAASMRLGEEGVATVHACIGPNGRLSEEPSIAKTSGSARLDEGALKLSKAGHYNPGTEDGKPVTACINFGIRFQLKN